MTVIDDAGRKAKAPAAATLQARADFRAKLAALYSEGRPSPKSGIALEWPFGLSQPAQHLEADAKERGLAAIIELFTAGYIVPGTLVRGRELIEVLFKANTVDASIGPEDGGLIFYWAARDMAITIEIFPSAGYWWSVRSIGAEKYSGTGEELPLLDLRHSLNQFSKEVERQNPNWRSVVR